MCAAGAADPGPGTGEVGTVSLINLFKLEKMRIEAYKKVDEEIKQAVGN
jgi:hypothetical protein